MRATLGIVMLTLAVWLAPTAHASEAELQEAYVAYQEAAEAGDLRAALPHAERAYELGLELYGAESRNTGLLAFNYGYLLLEARQLSQSIQILRISLNALEANASGEQTAAIFEARLELARACADDASVPWRTADEAAREALSTAQSVFGEGSREVGLAHLQIAYNAIPRSVRDEPPPSTISATYTQRRLSLVEPGPVRLWQILGTTLEGMETYRNEVLRYEDLASATSIFEGEVLSSYWLALFYGVQGFYRGMDWDITQSNENYAALHDLLNEQQFAEDNSFKLLVNWGLAESYKNEDGDHVRFTDFPEDLREVAAYRTVGTIVPVSTPYPDYPESLQEEMVSADVTISYYVDRSGVTENLEVLEPDEHPAFIDVAVGAVEKWSFFPAVSDGRAVRSGPHLVTVRFRAERRTRMQAMDAFESSLAEVFATEVEARNRGAAR